MQPDETLFPALKLAREALQSGGSAPTILNAANEVAVYAFLAGKIGFLNIARIVEETLNKQKAEKLSSLEMVHEVDAQARATAEEILRSVMD